MPISPQGGRSRTDDDSLTAKGGGSIGRAAVSKTAGCRFKSCPPCSSIRALARVGSSDGGINQVARNVIDEPSEDIVAAARQDRGTSRGPFGRLVLFLRQVINELKKVVTPTRKELFSYTGVVLVFVVIMMALVYGLDVIFALGVNTVFGK